MLMDSLKKTAEDIRDNAKFFVYCIMLDLIFIFSFFFLRTIFSSMALEPIKKLVESAQRRAQISLTDFTAASEFADLMAVFNENKVKLILIGISFMVALTLAWSLFQGIAWFLSSKMSRGKKTGGFLSYLWSFTRISFLWMFILSSLSYLFITLSIPTNLQGALKPAQAFILKTGFYVIIPFVAFFIPISLSLSRKGARVLRSFIGSFRTGFRRFFYYLSAYAAFIALSYLLIALQSIVPSLFIKTILGLFTSLPLIAFFRVFLLNLTTALKRP